MNEKINVLKFNIEDWFSVLDIKHYWGKFKDKIVKKVKKILKILKDKDVNATIFIVGYFASKYPDLIEEIKNDNNEMASYGYIHSSILDLKPNQFREDLIFYSLKFSLNDKL